MEVDSSYHSDPEVDSDHECISSDPVLKPGDALQSWLCQLNDIGGPEPTAYTQHNGATLPHPSKSSPVDAVRFSKAALEDTQDTDLDAILGELCALETQFQTELDSFGPSDSKSSGNNRNVAGNPGRKPTPPAVARKPISREGFVGPQSAANSQQSAADSQPSAFLSESASAPRVVSCTPKSFSQSPARGKPTPPVSPKPIPPVSLKPTPPVSPKPTQPLPSRTQAPAVQGSVQTGTGVLGVVPLESADSSRTPGRTAETMLRIQIDKGRTSSPDADSAFSDNVSLLSSDSSASSGAGTTAATAVPSSAGISAGTPQRPDSASLVNSEQEVVDGDQSKAHKIRLALEKIQQANVKKLFVKVFAEDGSTKSILVDERMTCGYITAMVAEKKHLEMDWHWTLVEKLPDLYMERIYEDHELLVECLLLWTADSTNRLEFVRRPIKHDVFQRPERYLLAETCGDDATTHQFQMDASTRHQLIQEKFSTGTAVPNLEGQLWLKSDGKKAWKRYPFVLRASGIYYLPKGKLSGSKSLVCVASLDNNQIYSGYGWKQKYKAPTDFGIAIKHPHLQSAVAKHIRYLCMEDQATWRRWLTAMRLAKHGRTLLENYERLSDELTMPPPPSPHLSLSSRLSQHLHQSADSVTSAFVSDSPQGTIKRRPAGATQPCEPRHVMQHVPAGPTAAAAGEDDCELPAPPQELLDCQEELPPPPAELLRGASPASGRRVRFCETTPSRLASSQCTVAPPPEFLSHLRTVMHRKWAVAEKCRVNRQLPHQVLGFRDALATEADKEAQVGRWLRQHYGDEAEGHPAQMIAPCSNPPPPPPRQPQSILKRPFAQAHAHTVAGTRF